MMDADKGRLAFVRKHSSQWIRLSTLSMRAQICEIRMRTSTRNVTVQHQTQTLENSRQQNTTQHVIISAQLK